MSPLWRSLDIDKFEWKILVPPTGSKSFAAKVFHGWKLESNNLLTKDNFNAFNLLSMSISFKPPFSKLPIKVLCLIFGRFPLHMKSFWILHISLTTSPDIYCTDDSCTNFEKNKDLKTWILPPSVKPLCFQQFTIVWILSVTVRKFTFWLNNWS